MYAPQCDRPGCGHGTFHVGWYKTAHHYFKVFCCWACGKRQYIAWDHERPNQ